MNEAKVPAANASKRKADEEEEGPRKRPNNQFARPSFPIMNPPTPNTNGSKRKLNMAKKNDPRKRPNNRAQAPSFPKESSPTREYIHQVPESWKNFNPTKNCPSPVKTPPGVNCSPGTARQKCAGLDSKASVTTQEVAIATQEVAVATQEVAAVASGPAAGARVLRSGGDSSSGLSLQETLAIQPANDGMTHMVQTKGSKSRHGSRFANKGARRSSRKKKRPEIFCSY